MHRVGSPRCLSRSALRLRQQGATTTWPVVRLAIAPEHGLCFQAHARNTGFAQGPWAKMAPCMVMLPDTPKDSTTPAAKPGAQQTSESDDQQECMHLCDMMSGQGAVRATANLKEKPRYPSGQREEWTHLALAIVATTPAIHRACPPTDKVPTPRVPQNAITGFSNDEHLRQVPTMSFRTKGG